MGVKISQEDNYKGNFGDVLRSSALFWYRKSSTFRTTCSVFNYWPLKRKLSVAVVYSLRALDGTLVERRRVEFTRGQVVNLTPGPDDFEGSLEVEVFSTDNMVIPYAAIMAVYETPTSKSLVHSYGRAYSNHEIEEKRTITIGEESCWTVRDAPGIRSFGVFHNGSRVCPPQRMRLAVRRADGQTLAAEVALPELAPYQTVVVRPGEHLPEIERFLGGQPGNASLSFRTEGAFTRMLVGNERTDGSDSQVTHSNFDYSRHETDLVRAEQQAAYMYLPQIAGYLGEVVVYPDRHPGEYRVEGHGPAHVLGNRMADTLSLGALDAPQTLRFSRADGSLPTRLVTGLRVQPHVPNALPCECSLGVEHHARPPKRFWWGLAGADTVHSRLVTTALDDIYGPAGAVGLELKLYSSARNDSLSVRLDSADALAPGRTIESLFPGAREFLAGAYGWWTLFSEYGGLTLYSTLEDEKGAFAIEHGF